MAAIALGLLPGASPAAAVSHAAPVSVGRFPWMAALLDRGGEHFCGGSIVAKDVILTAAHCVDAEAASGIQVQAGSVHLDHGAVQRRDVRQIRVHPRHSTRSDRYDVAVLILTRPFDVTARVQPIRLADRKAQAPLLASAAPAIVMGWGSTSDRHERYPNQLRAASVRVTDDASCNDQWEGEIHGPSMLCATSLVGADACAGDSGGPLVAQDPVTRGWFQIGVVSFGDTCDDPDLPGVYADVARLAPFVAGRGAGGRSPTHGPR